MTTETTPQVGGARTLVEQVKAIASAQPPVAGAVTEGKGGEANLQAPKTYSEQEWLKREKEMGGRISGQDKKITDLTKTLASLQDKHSQQLKATQEFEETALIKATEADGGDVNLVKKTLDRERHARELAQTLEQREAQILEKEKFYENVARQENAKKLIAEHGLEAEAFETLMQLGTPVEMENAALKMVVAKKATEAIPTQKLDSGGRVTSGDDISKLSFRDKIARALGSSA